MERELIPGFGWAAGGWTGHVLSLCILSLFDSFLALQALTFPKSFSPECLPLPAKLYVLTALRLQPEHHSMARVNWKRDTSD